MDDLHRGAEALAADIVAWRRRIHQHPELGNREFETAELVAQRLREALDRVEDRLKEGTPAAEPDEDEEWEDPRLELVEQLPRLDERPGVEALGEPVVDGREHVLGLLPLAALGPSLVTTIV